MGKKLLPYLHYWAVFDYHISILYSILKFSFYCGKWSQYKNWSNQYFVRTKYHDASALNTEYKDTFMIKCSQITTLLEENPQYIFTFNPEDENVHEHPIAVANQSKYSISHQKLDRNFDYLFRSS